MATTYPTFSSPQRVFDVVKFELDQRYTRKSYPIKNTSGTAMTAGMLAPGYPFDLVSANMEPLLTTAEANCAGLYVDHRPSPVLANGATTTLEYDFLVRGPALVNASALPVLDMEGATLVPATIMTALAALSPPILGMAQPAAASVSTQVN